jgi:hypothetical protein
VNSRQVSAAEALMFEAGVTHALFCLQGSVVCGQVTAAQTDGGGARFNHLLGLHDTLLFMQAAESCVVRPVSTAPALIVLLRWRPPAF